LLQYFGLLPTNPEIADAKAPLTIAMCRHQQTALPLPTAAGLGAMWWLPLMQKPCGLAVAPQRPPRFPAVVR